MLQPCLLQPCFHVAGGPERGHREGEPPDEVRRDARALLRLPLLLLRLRGLHGRALPDQPAHAPHHEQDGVREARASICI